MINYFKRVIHFLKGKSFRILLILLSLSTVKFSHACTIVSCSLKGEVFAAANEDEYTPFMRVWFNPGTANRYGSVCFGAPDLQIAAAINEYGLFYDYTFQSDIDPGKYNLKHPYGGDLFFEILGKCKTVKEALQFLETHDFTASSQVLLADATGNSVIINVGTKALKKGHYQISTNFNICNIATGHYTCGRYDIANAMLSKTKSVSVPFLTNLLSKTHQEGNLSTIYSNVYDLKRGIIYVYLFHDYTTPYIINVKEELSKGYRLDMLADHFPPSFAYQTFTQNNPQYKKELIMSEIKEQGLQTTVAKYISQLTDNSKTDSTLPANLLDVAIQLIKDANNQHNNGRVWSYWFSLSDGYDVIRYNDERLDAAAQIFNASLKQQPDVKYKNFIKEMLAYINLVENKTSLAKESYQQLAKEPDKTFPVTYNRSREIIKHL